jgi:hypothetical protein
MRDSIGNLYIHGKEPDTDICNRGGIRPTFVVNLDGKPTYENQGNMGVEMILCQVLL